MGRMYYQGKYKPENPSKYRGDINNIVYRSSWEFKSMKFCDLNPNILFWGSEETIIPYISPLDGRPHRYFMDLTIWVKNQDGTIGKALIEIKPYDQTQEPVKKQGKPTKRYMEEVSTYVVNRAKWDAARVLCEKEGWKFVIWTERELLPNGKLDVKELDQQKRFEDKMKKAFRKKKSPKVEMYSKVVKDKLKAVIAEQKEKGG